MKKTFIAANDLLLDSFRLAVNIQKAGFNPDFLVGLWRGAVRLASRCRKDSSI
jgi:hypoxanthine phosphoribosyltransferase